MRARMISWMVLAASLLVASQAMAQPNGQVTFGGQWWNQSANEAKFDEFRVVPQGGFLGSYFLRESTGPWTASFYGANGLQKDQRNTLMLARGVKYRLDASVFGTPHVYSHLARSPFTQVSPGVFTLPDSLQRLLQQYAGAGNNAGTAAYAAALNDLLKGADRVPLALQTNLSRLRARMRPSREWQFEVSGTRRQRSGSLALGVPFGIGGATMTEIAAPIDQRVIDADATATWLHGNYRVLGSFGMSSFRNGVSTLRVDNSRRLTDSATGAAVGQMDLWPDNNVARGRVSFSAQLPYDAQFTATVGMSQSTQDDKFLPFTTNTTIAQSALDSLPARSADAKVDQTVQDYRLTGRPVDKVFATLRFHSDKTENKTKSLTFNGFVPYDQSFSPALTSAGIQNDPFGGKNDVLGADLDFTLTHDASLSLLVEHRAREHDHREVEKDAENVYGGKLRVQLMDNLDLSGGYRYGQRKLDKVFFEDFENDTGAVLEPLGLRRFDVADRNQTVANAGMDWAVDPRLDLSVTWTYSKDDYKNSVYGLQSADNSMVFGEASVHASKVLELSGGFGYGEAKAKQASSEYGIAVRRDTSVAMNWWVATKDKNVFAFAHADWTARPKLLFRADYTFARTLGEFDITNTTLLSNGTRRAPAGDVPSQFYRSHDVVLEGTWRYTPQLDVSAQFEYQQFKLSDFAAQNVPLLGGSLAGTTFTPNAIYLGDSYQNYDARRIAVMVSRRF